MKVKTAAESLITAVSVGVGLILLNFLTCQSHVRMDLTEQKIYTLSPESARLVKALPEKMVVKAYIDDMPPEVANQQQYLENLLEEYAVASGGRLAWEKIKPGARPELQDELKKIGINKIRLTVVNKDKREEVFRYFAVVFSYLDKKEIWTPDRGFSMERLEYEFTSRIKRLSPGKKKAGVTVGFGEPQQTQLLSVPEVGLVDLYDVVPINWATGPRELANVDVLIVNGPTDKVSDVARYHLDQYLMSGKPVLFLIRGVKWSGGGNQQMDMMGQEEPYMGMPAQHGLDDLLGAYGFAVAQNTVIDVKNTAAGAILLGGQPLTLYGFFPIAQSLAVGEGDILQGIRAVVMPFTSSVTLVGPLGKGAAAPDAPRVRPLLSTLATSFRQGDLMIITRDLRLKRPADDAFGPNVVAYAAEGKFKSFFADKPRPEGVDVAPPPKPEPGEENMSAPPPGETVKESPVTTRVIVMGSSEVVDDKLVVAFKTLGPMAQDYVNGFRAVHNMVDWLVNDTDLIGVRAKQIARPVKPLDNADRLLVKYGNIAGPPLALVLFGVVYWRVREKRRKHVKL